MSRDLNWTRAFKREIFVSFALSETLCNLSVCASIKQLNLYYRIVSHNAQPADRTFQELRRYQRRAGGLSYNRDRLTRVDEHDFRAYVHEKDRQQRDLRDRRLVLVHGERVLSNNDRVRTSRPNNHYVPSDDRICSRFFILYRHYRRK